MPNRTVRSSFRDVARTAAQPAIIFLLSLFVAYVGLEVWLAAQIGLWRTSLATDTAVWAITSGTSLGYGPNERPASS